MSEFATVFNPAATNAVGAEAVKAENVKPATKPTAGAAGEVVVGTIGVARQQNVAITQKAGTLKYTIKHNLASVVLDVTPYKEIAGPKYELNTIKAVIVLNANEVEIEFASVVESAVWWFAICG